VKFWKIFGLIALLAIPKAEAANSVFAKFYEIDLENDQLPSLQELEDTFNQQDNYNRKFNSQFDLIGDFDNEFATTIATYGHQEKRLKSADEDLMIDFIKQFPPIYYQYIGPQLFEIPGMSKKILNMPGIKETKHKFPTRIADEVKDIENLEYISPSLYFILMPEAWSTDNIALEDPPTPYYSPKIKYNPKFYALVKKLVPAEQYMPGYKAPNTKGRDDLRTLYPTKDTLLTSADVKAVIATLDKVEEWYNRPETLYQMYRIETMLSIYESKDELGRYAHSEIRNMVNPCARLVQKARIAGKERELASIVAPHGFTLNEWGYSCDKTVHAYRLSNATYGVVQSIRLFQRGIYDGLYKSFSPEFRLRQMAVMQALVKGYQAPVRDVLAVKKNRDVLDKKLKNREYEIFGHPVFFD